MASSDVIWQLVRNNSSYIIKRDGHVFTTEPRNLTAKHSFAASSLAQPKAIGVEEGEEVGEVVVSTKTKVQRKPAKSVKSRTMKKKGHGFHKIAAKLEIEGYRKDLKKAALRRFYRLYKTEKQ